MKSLLAACLAALLAAVPVAEADDAPLPIFDMHLHYNREPGYRLPPADVLDLFHRSGVRGILANSRPNDGTHELLARHGQDLRVVPFLRPYRTRADVRTWHSDPAVFAFIEAEFPRAPWRGIGEFHVFGRDADSEWVRRTVRLARDHGLVLLAHCDEEALGLLFAHAPDATIVWAHTGFDVPPARVAAWLEAHPRLTGELSYRGGITDAAGRLTDAWRVLFERFPTRFVVGSDTWIDARWDDYANILDGYRRWLAQLPRPIAERIAWRNAEALLPP